MEYLHDAYFQDDTDTVISCNHPNALKPPPSSNVFPFNEPPLSGCGLYPLSLKYL